jgi:hypothetical protein
MAYREIGMWEILEVLRRVVQGRHLFRDKRTGSFPHLLLG